jgi:uncharacterized OB-fold protein
LIPVDDDYDTGGFFAAAKKHQLVVRACASCGATLHLPRAYCYHCGSFDTRWVGASERGTLFSWTTVEHQIHPGYDVPYTIVLVDVDAPPAVRLTGNIKGRPALEIGMPMEVWWDEVGDGVVIPNWKPARSL